MRLVGGGSVINGGIQNFFILFFFSRPEKGVGFLLHQLMIDCDMIHAIFLNFYNGLKLFQKWHLNKLSISNEEAKRLQNVNFSPNLRVGPP